MELSQPTIEKYQSLQKIDAHLHLNVNRQALQNLAAIENFKLLTINTDVPFFPTLNEQQNIALLTNQTHSVPVDFITSFTTDNWGTPFWQDEAIEQIKKGIDNGAVGVKIWKNIGMNLKDKDGNFIMCDHPSFNPIYEYLVIHEIPLLAHLGEPKNCWLPVDQMTVLSDREYYTKYPQYHMYEKNEFPTYKDQLYSRDHLLEKHSNLIFIGAHLASLEWSIDEQAAWLDKHPNCGVDLAERVSHLQYQASNNAQKVKDFVETYQDRIIYGTDHIDDCTTSEPESRRIIQNKWHSEFCFFAENSEQTISNLEKPYQGIGLNISVLKKLYRENAFRYYRRLTN